MKSDTQAVRLRHYCAADMENFGDVLYALLIKSVLDRRLDCSPLIENVSFISGPAALRGGFDLQPIRKLFQAQAAPLPLLIGGGDILRLDDEAVAACYQGRYRELVGDRHKERAPALVTKSSDGRQTMSFTFDIPRPMPTPAWFHRSYMPPMRGAFLLSPENCPGASAVAYVSAGVPFHFLPTEAQFVRQVFNAAAGIWVRDELSREKLLEAGVNQDIIVAPDLAILTETLFPRESLRPAAMNLLQKLGLDYDERYLCFQVNSTGMNFIETIAQSLHELSRWSGKPIVLLPLGFAVGDRETLQKIHRRLPEVTRYANVETVHEMLALIAWSTGFTGVSMHGNIVAFSYGVPNVFAPLDVDKIGGVMRMLGLPASQRLESWHALPLAMSSLLQTGESGQRAEVVSKLQTQTFSAADQVFNALGLLCPA